MATTQVQLTAEDADGNQVMVGPGFFAAVESIAAAIATADERLNSFPAESIAVTTEAAWREFAPAARQLVVRNVGAGHLEVNVNDGGWFPLDGPAEKYGKLDLRKCAVTRIGLRTPSGATTASVMHGRII